MVKEWLLISLFFFQHQAKVYLPRCSHYMNKINFLLHIFFIESKVS